MRHPAQRPRRGRPARGGAALLLLAAACGAANGEARRALEELERLVFVPAAPRCTLEGFVGAEADCSVQRDLVVDRFETTRDDWRAVGFDVPADDVWRSEDRWADVAEGSWPMFLSQEQARAYAARRGMRLLRAREWLHVAVGPRGHRYPWGPKDQRSTANTLELGLARPLPVGTFESGRSQPFGCYDLLGNVWEWVADRVPGYGDLPGAERQHPPGSPGSLVSAMGGSYLSRKHETYGPARSAGRAVAFHAVSLDPAHRAPDVGVRLGMEAEVYLWEHAPAWGAGPDARARIEAVGRAWGREALPLLEALAERPGAPANLVHLRAGARRASAP